jgi:hypothetical protein
MKHLQCVESHKSEAYVSTNSWKSFNDCVDTRKCGVFNFRLLESYLIN